MEELWEKLNAAKLYTNSFEDFKIKYGTEEAQKDLFNKLSAAKLYTNSFEDFTNKYFTGKVLGPVSEAALTEAAENQKQQIDTESKSEDGSLELQAYDLATNISDSELAGLKEEVDQLSFEPIEKQRFTVGRKTALGFEPGRTETFYEQPYKNYLDKAKKTLEKNPPEEGITGESIVEAAKRIMLNEKKYALLSKKNNEYLSNISEEEKNRIYGEKVEKYKSVDKAYENDVLALELAIKKRNEGANLKNLEFLDKALNDPEFTFDLKQTIAEGKEIVTLEDGREVPLEVIKDYEEAIKKENEFVEYVNFTRDKILNDVEQLKDLPQALDFLKKNYNFVDRLQRVAYTSIGQAGLGIGVGFLDLMEGAMEATPFKGDLKKPLDESIKVVKEAKDKLIDVSSRVEPETQEKFAAGVSFEDAFSSPENFGKFTAEALAGQTGTFLTIAATGQAAPVSIGLQGYGGKITDIAALDKASEKVTSSIEKRLTALGFGAFEATLGTLPTMRILKNAKVNLGATASPRGFYQGVRDFAKTNYKPFLNDQITEVVGEGGTQFFQNGIEVARGEMAAANIFEGVPEAAFTGGLVGVTLSSAPVIKGAVLSAFSSEADYAQFDRNVKRIEALTRRIEKKKVEGSKKPKAEVKGNTKEYKEIVAQIEALEAENNTILDNIEKNISSKISPEGFELYKKLTAEQGKIIAEVKRIQNDALPRTEKQRQLEVQQQLFNQLEAQKKVFKKNFKNTFAIEDSKVRKEYLSKAKDANPDSNKDSLEKEAAKLYNLDKIAEMSGKMPSIVKALNKAGIKTEAISSADNETIIQRAKEYFEDLAEKGVITKNKATESYREFRREVLNGSVNGVNLPTYNAEAQEDGSLILISEANMLKNGRTATISHEAGHSLFVSAIGSGQKAYAPMAQTILSYLKLNNKKAYNRILLKSVENGNVIPDEVIMNFIEETASGRMQLDKNKGLFAVAGLAIRKTLGKITGADTDFTFDGEPDVVEFLKGVSNLLSRKDITDKQVRVASTKIQKLKDILKDQKNEKGLSIKFSKTIEELSKALTDLEDQAMEGLIDFDEYEARISALEKQISDAQKKKVTDEDKTKKTKKQKKTTDKTKAADLKKATAKTKAKLDRIGNDPNGFDKNNPEIYETLTGLIKSKSRAFKTASNKIVNLNALPGFDMDSMVSETIANMVPYIAKFDPAKNDSLYGYINAQLNNRMKAALKSGKVTESKFTDDVTQIKGLAVPEASKSEPDKPEKPKYTKLIDSGMLPPEVVETITEKLVRSIRVLKTRLDADVTNNVNVTPLIREILDEISTQADIDLKTLMGGKKDGKLESFLRKNKQAILENLTTTFLQGKDQGGQVKGGIPIAIQKQVNGEFLSYPDWAGKTPDRETTLKRGNTAGQNIVRRVPANKIPTAQFLKFVINSTGNPIRGRKEALAKELSGEIALELLNEQILAEQGPLFDAFIENQERLGVDIADNLANKVALQIERGNIKFSKKADIENALISQLNTIGDINTQASVYLKAVLRAIGGLEQKELTFEVLKLAMLPSSEELGMSLRDIRQFSAILWSQLKDANIVSTAEMIKKGAEIFEKYKHQKRAIAAIRITKLAAKEIKKQKSNKAKSEFIVNFVKNFSLPTRASGLNGIRTTEQYVAYLKSEFGPKLIEDNFKIVEVLKGKSLIIKNTANVPAKHFGSASFQKRTIINAIEKGTSFKNIVNDIEAESKEAFELVTGLIEYYTANFGKQTAIDVINVLNAYNQDTIIRKLSKFKGIEQSLIDNPKLLENAVWEHETEVSSIMKQLITYIESGQTKKDKDALRKDISNYYINLVSEKTNKKITGTSLKDIDRYEANSVEINEELAKFSKTPSLKELFSWRHYDGDGADVAMYKIGGVRYYINMIDARVYDTPPKYVSALNKLVEKNNLDDGTVLMSSQSAVVEFGDASGDMDITGKLGNKAISFFRVVGTNVVEFVKNKGLQSLIFTAEDQGNRRRIYGMFAKSIANSLGWQTDFNNGAYIIWNNNNPSLQKIDFSEEFKSEFDGDLDDFDFSIKFSKSFAPKALDKEFNLMLERKSGIAAGKEISKARAEQLGSNKGRFRYFVPPNTEDFVGFLYNFLGKGKQGDEDFKFFREVLIDPFNEAENKISSFRQKLGEDLRLLKKEMGNIDKDISPETIKKIEEIGFTPDQAVRVFIWNRRGEEIPDLTDQEKARILSVVRRDVKLMKYAMELTKITEKFGGYPPPGKNWFAGNSRSDLYKFANENVRAEMLEQWQANADAIFSSENMTKLQAIYGKDFVKELKAILRRMKSGTNRPVGMNDAGSKFLDYLNGSVGVIMFLNIRSAVLQTISAVNFINWHDNNIFKAGKTLSNPKNFAKEFLNIMNSDFLKQRRDGLEINVSEAEIASAAEQSKNKAKALFAKVMKAGYKPTQFADSFAIAIGGTPFLINRMKTYIDSGFTEAEARKKAFTDFREIAEENQQSSRTDKTSNIQASSAGRILFAFNNTPFQYTRIMKKAFLDIANGRGDIKTNISKIIYYGAVQNFIFYALQQALMAAVFGGDEEDQADLNSRLSRMGNGMLDTILRGSGLSGAVISTVKNTIMEYVKQEARGDFLADHGKTVGQLLNISPPVGSKYTKIYSGITNAKYEDGTIDFLKNKSKIASAVTNIPLDRLVTKVDNMQVAATQPIETWKRAALVFGWDQWSLGVYDDLKKIEWDKNKKPKKSRSEIMKEVWKKRKAEDKAARMKILKNQASKFK